MLVSHCLFEKLNSTINREEVENCFSLGDMISLYLKLNLDNMKKLFTLLFGILPFVLFSQVQLVSTDATKIYPDDTRITYMQLSDYPVDANFLQFVEIAVMSNTSIQRFKLAKDGTSCFYQSQKDITEDMVVDAINDAYSLYFTTDAGSFTNIEYDNSDVNQGSKDFKERGYLNEYYVCRFFLDIDDDNVLVADIINAFKESGFISDVDYNGNSYFEVYSLGLIYPVQIESLLGKWGVNIQKESLK